MIDEARFRAVVREEVQKALAELGPSAEWLSQQDAAKHCGVDVSTIRNWHRQGLKFQRVGKVTRYSRADLESFLKRNTQKDPDAWADQILARRKTG
jgi:transposase